MAKTLPTIYVRTLKRGVSPGADVYRAMLLLRVLGYLPASHKIGKSYGLPTRLAVRAFKAAHGLPKDTQLGPAGWRALERAYAKHERKPVRPVVVDRPKPAPSARAKCVSWLEGHLGITEQPAGSNTDGRADGIRAAQLLVAGGGSWLLRQPWCGVWACTAALHAGVRIPQPSRWAGVANIEDDARRGVNGFRIWTGSTAHVLRGDLAVLFGRGVHVETVLEVHPGYIVTIGGNTSSGTSGSQSNGGGAFRRVRPLSSVHGFALVDYPN